MNESTVTGQEFRLVERVQDGDFTIGVFSDGHNIVKSTTLPRHLCTPIKSHPAIRHAEPSRFSPSQSHDRDSREISHNSHTGS